MGAHLTREEIEEFSLVLNGENLKVIYTIFLILFLGYLYLNS